MNYDNKLITDIIASRKEKYTEIKNQSKNGILLYGAGFIGRWALDYFKGNRTNIKYIVDRDEKKWGNNIDGVEVVGPDDVRIKNYPYIVISVRHYVKEIEELYDKQGATAMSFDAYYTIEKLSEYEDIRDNSMEDEMSKKTYNALLYTALTGDVRACEDVMVKDMYFALPRFSGGSMDEIFVDVGAFVGDSTERFVNENLGAFRHVYAFEPGKKQYTAMQKRIKRLCEEWCIEDDVFSLVRAGLSNRSCKMSSELALDTHMRDVLVEDNDNGDICVYTLDEYLAGREVTFIKADIEGMEMEMLQGAKETIEKYKPKIAISAYHYPCDLYCIAKYIKSINKEYKFDLRLHSRLWGDFVLYCY